MTSIQANCQSLIQKTNCIGMNTTEIKSKMDKIGTSKGMNSNVISYYCTDIGIVQFTINEDNICIKYKIGSQGGRYNQFISDLNKELLIINSHMWHNDKIKVDLESIGNNVINLYIYQKQ
jgi:hypothetical protein